MLWVSNDFVRGSNRFVKGETVFLALVGPNLAGWQ